MEMNAALRVEAKEAKAEMAAAQQASGQLTDSG